MKSLKSTNLQLIALVGTKKPFICKIVDSAHSSVNFILETAPYQVSWIWLTSSIYICFRSVVTSKTTTKLPPIHTTNQNHLSITDGSLRDISPRPPSTRGTFLTEAGENVSETLRKAMSVTEVVGNW